MQDHAALNSNKYTSQKTMIENIYFLDAKNIKVNY